MKKVTTLVCIVLIAFPLFAQKSLEKDKEEIKKIIQSAYVEGLQNEGDMEKIDAGIHPGFNLIGIGEAGKMWSLPIEDWKKKTLKKKEKGEYPKTGDKKVSVKFLMVDVTGSAGIAKIEFYVGETLKYVDYISLYKFPEGWKMVNKIYYKFPD